MGRHLTLKSGTLALLLQTKTILLMGWDLFPPFRGGLWQPAGHPAGSYPDCDIALLDSGY